MSKSIKSVDESGARHGAGSGAGFLGEEGENLTV